MKQSRLFTVHRSLFTVRRSLFTVYCSLITVLFLAHTLFYFFALGSDAIDDAYISFRYAQNAIRGYGLFFNPGERVEGFTNFLWTALMVPLEGAHVDVGRLSMLLGVLFALGTLWLVVRFARSVGAPQSVELLAVLLLAVDGSFAIWAVGGLETPMFAFLILAGALLYVNEQASDARRGSGGAEGLTAGIATASTWPLSGIFFALATMTRPEGLLVFAVTVGHQLVWRVLAERRLFTWRDVGRVTGFAALFVPYWLGRWWYYKSFLPNSFYAKVSASGPAAQLERGWNYLGQFVNVHLGWLMVIPPVVALVAAIRGLLRRESSPDLRRSHPPGPSALASSHSPFAPRPSQFSPLFWQTHFALVIVSYSAYIVYVGGDWSVGRFFVPWLPMFYLLFSTGIVDMWRWAVDKLPGVWTDRAAWAGVVASVLLAIGLLAASSWNGEYGIYVKGFDTANATMARETMGKWLRANVPPGTLIAVDAAGQVPYFSELPAIDMFGINDLHIGRLSVPTLGEGTPGHEKFDLVYVITRAPRYVVIYGTLLDNVKEYERASATWTENPKLLQFLTLYERRSAP